MASIKTQPKPLRSPQAGFVTAVRGEAFVRRREMGEGVPELVDQPTFLSEHRVDRVCGGGVQGQFQEQRDARRTPDGWVSWSVLNC